MTLRINYYNTNQAMSIEKSICKKDKSGMLVDCNFDGKQKYFNEDGSLIRIDFYRKGIKINKTKEYNRPDPPL